VKELQLPRLQAVSATKRRYSFEYNDNGSFNLIRQTTSGSVYKTTLKNGTLEDWCQLTGVMSNQNIIYNSNNEEENIYSLSNCFNFEDCLVRFCEFLDQQLIQNSRRLFVTVNTFLKERSFNIHHRLRLNKCANMAEVIAKVEDKQNSSSTYSRRVNDIVDSAFVEVQQQPKYKFNWKSNGNNKFTTEYRSLKEVVASKTAMDLCDSDNDAGLLFSHHSHLKRKRLNKLATFKPRSRVRVLTINNESETSSSFSSVDSNDDNSLSVLHNDELKYELLAESDNIQEAWKKNVGTSHNS